MWTYLKAVHAARGTVRLSKIIIVMGLPVPLVLHGDLEAAVEDFVEGVDPVLHLPLAVGRQQIRALILHLQLKGKPPDFGILNYSHAGVQENGSFGLFGYFLILVKVEVIGAVSQLGQMEISPLEGPHGDADGTVHVAFVKPAMFGKPTFL